MAKEKETLLIDYISLNKKILKIARSVIDFTPKELKEKVTKMDEKESKIKLELNKIGYQIYFNSSKGNYDLRKI